jgi:hypothetical protein
MFDVHLGTKQSSYERLRITVGCFMNEKNQDKPPVTVKAGQIQFAEACHPPLVAGEYQAAMTQFIRDPDNPDIPWNSDPYLSELVFAVDAPRFTLNPAEIDSVYPPVNEIGRFDNALPHVVFTRRTLPWERTLDGMPPKLGRAFPPWMGLLLLEEDELLILDETGQETGRSHQVKSLPVACTDQDSLLFARDESVLVPDLGQSGPGDKADPESRIRSQKWEKEKFQYQNESCLAIDLPAELFKAVAPRTDDLAYLAHARQVDTSDKEVLGINDKGWFSLVIGNRVPRADQSHCALLVSLEGCQDRLKEGWKPADGQFVRLAVLCSWKFTCKGSNDFKARMNQLNIGGPKTNESGDSKLVPDAWLHLPNEEYDDNSLAVKNIINGAYARGYTVFNHVMRQGEKTVSWYRGPLVPLNYDKPAQVQEPVANADELLRYDPDTGLFELTYAAAWQLGRLLALQNQGFALALNRARSALRAKAARLMQRAALKDTYRELELKDDDFVEDRLMDKVADDIGEKMKKAVP